jgi:hypothetical protein
VEELMAESDWVPGVDCGDDDGEVET